MTDSTSDNSLILHFPMDEITEGKVQDHSSNDSSGTVHGGATIVPDDLFGSCLMFDGVDDYIELDPAPLTNVSDQVTVSFWAWGDDTLPKSTSILYAVDSNNNRIFNIHLPHSSENVYWDCGWQDGSYDRINKIAQSIDSKGRWTHGACSKDGVGGAMQMDLNGALWHSGSGKTKPVEDITQIVIGSISDGGFFWPGKLAHFSIHNAALTANEIQECMLSAQNAQASFRMTYPLDISFADQDQPNVLYISEGDTVHTLQVTVENMSKQTIAIDRIGSANAANAATHHFEIKFKPRTFQAAIDPSQLDSIVNFTGPAALLGEWTISPPQIHPDGKVSLYILYIGATRKLLSPTETISVDLQYSSADRGGGARSTTVQFLYDNLHYLNDSEEIDTAVVAGTRIKTFDIINQRGKKNIPLMAAVIGSNKILNNGDANTIKIRVANMLKPVPEHPERNKLMFNVGNLDAERNTKFTLWFDDPAGMDWDLATSGQLQAIDVEAHYLDKQTQEPNSFTVTRSNQGTSVSWEITPSIEALGSEEYFEIHLKNIKTDATSGMANIYLGYEDIQGYWDGQKEIVVEKGPLMYQQSNIGIGIASPEEKLHVFGNIKSAENLYIGGNIGIGTIGPKAKLSIEGSEGAKYGVHIDNREIKLRGDGHQHFSIYNHKTADCLTIENTSTNSDMGVDGTAILSIHKDGNVGIGTTGPSQRLQVNGNAIIGDSRETLKIGNMGHGGWAGIAHSSRANKNDYALIQHSNGETILNAKAGQELRLRQGNSDRMMIHENGNVGIGTTAPSSKLDVNGTIRTHGLHFSDEVSSHINTDGSLYRYAGQVYLTVDDNFYIRDSSGSNNFHFQTNDRRLEINGSLRLRSGENYVDMSCDNTGFNIFLRNTRYETNDRRTYRWDGDSNWDLNTSDIRLKTNITNEENILARLLQLNVKNFNWKTAPDMKPKKIGFIAQDVEPLFPELVGNIEDPETKETNLALKYTDFGVLAVGAIKELKTETDAIITKLKDEIKELKKLLT